MMKVIMEITGPAQPAAHFSQSSPTLEIFFDIVSYSRGVQNVCATNQHTLLRCDSTF